MRLNKLEEDAIVERILELDSRGFPPTKAILREMANKLLAERGGGEVGQNWPCNFLKRQDRLKTCWNRPYDRQRAQCEDRAAVEAWFDLVRNMKAKYGILDEDTYNFDETGFMMGVITSQLVITGSERRGKRKVVQPGNREWTTVINAICASGWSIPPFTIFAGVNHINRWYEEVKGMETWRVATSSNGWTTNELGLAWLKHFDEHTKLRTQGTHRLLIIDGHESHNSVDFRDYCRENNIITLCMPAHSSHFLQPLDVAIFAPLKRAYGDQICGLARVLVTKVDKPAFIKAYKKAYDKVFVKNNILSAFKGAGLVPLDPEEVLSKLDVKLRTPTPPAPETTPWESKTPSNPREIEAQSALLTERIRRHRNSSPTSMIVAMKSLTKGVASMAHTSVLITDELTALRKAIEDLNSQKTRKRKYVQNRGTLTMAEGSQLATAAVAGGSSSGGEPTEGGRPEGAKRAARTCGICGQPGHDRRTCTTEVSDSSDSE